jgi:predicted phage-related endonuclease
VVAHIPPPIDGTESAKRLLSTLYPSDSGDVILADETIHETIHRYFETLDTLAELESQKLEYENRIKEHMGAASLLKGPGYRISWKATKERRIVNYKKILQEAQVPVELIEKHTTIQPGTRPFRVTRQKKEQ